MAGTSTSPRGSSSPPPKKKGGIDLGKPGAYSPPSKATGERAVFTKFIAEHPSLRNYANAIWHAAGTYGGITATQLAAILFVESGGDRGAKSNVGALGIAQIFDNAAAATSADGTPFFRADHNITTADKNNPAFAIQYAAWRLGGYASTHPGASIDDIWIGGYNPNYKPGSNGYIGPNPISAVLRKSVPADYVGIANSTPVDKAGNSVTQSQITGALRDPWVVGVGKGGKLIVNSNPTAPKSTVMYDGAPLTASGFKSVQRSLDNYFASYTGGRANPNIVLQYIQKGWGTYALTVALSKSKGFVNSPIYKKYAPAYQDAAQDLLPPGQKLPQSMIRSAIVNGWDTTTLAAVVRRAPGYIQSNEFKQNTATLSNVHQSIMGVPDANAQASIQEAAAAGWKPDQYAAYLRSLPQYTSSPEYQTKTLNFLSALGLITGATPVLKKGLPNPANPNQPDQTQIPNDPRLTAPTALARPEDTVATLNG